MALAPTPGQTAGPFFGFALPFARGHELVDPGTPGALRVHGTVTDGAGLAVPDAMIELWQADPDGNVMQSHGSFLRDGTFTGWGRTETDRAGGYWFRTVEPGPTEPGRAAYFAVTVFARGLQNRLFTRAYVPGNDTALGADPLLTSLPADAASTLVMAREADGSLRFDIRLQGEGETVFLTYDAGEHAGRDGVGA